MKIEEAKNYFQCYITENNPVKVHWNFKFLPSGFEAITLFGHVYDVQPKEQLRSFLETYWGRVMVNHERIHIMQAESFKLRYFTFYIIYLWWWIKGLFKCKFDTDRAYRNIPFEQEAYQNETNFEYNISNWKNYI